MPSIDFELAFKLSKKLPQLIYNLINESSIACPYILELLFQTGFIFSRIEYLVINPVTDLTVYLLVYEI